MIKCSKCNSIPDENDVIGWKCKSCGKAFKVTKSKLQNVLMRKAVNSEKSCINCPVCKNTLDDGNECIVWKCSCGNTNTAKLIDFEEEKDFIPKSNLIKCPECGRKILNDSRLCSYCGYLLEDETGREAKKQENVEIKEEDIKSHELNKGEFDNKQESLQDASGKKMLYGACVVFLLIFIIIVIAAAIAVTASENAKKCTLGSCDNYKMEGSEYCKDHTCKADGCTISKSKYDTYCYTHEQELCCSVEDCTSNKIEGGEYCYFHTCEKSGCYNKKFFDTDYCLDHQVDMRKKLTSSSFYFMLNSAGGIEFDFSAKNSTGKEIKYVRFNVELRNAVGDLVKDEIKNTSSVSVEIVGPVKSGGTVSMSNKIIGYCDTCARIDIDDITIIYTDGTSETGHFGYYYDR